jgi:hypothetical protein
MAAAVEVGVERLDRQQCLESTVRRAQGTQMGGCGGGRVMT